jgi:hypothetical protein
MYTLINNSASKILTLFILLTFFLIAGCEDDDGVVVEQNNSVLFSEMLDVLGGEQAVSNAKTLQVQVVGEAFEFQENPEPVEGKVADYTYALLYNLDGTQARQSWDIDAEYAYATQFAFVETIDGTKGKSEGPTGTFSARFGGFGVAGDPMFSTKIGARKKTLMMSSPIAMAKMMLENDIAGSMYGTINTNYHTSALGFGEDTPDIELIINTETKLPVSAQVLENDPLFGDVVYEVKYSNWTTVNGLQLPQTIEHVLNGFTIRKESLSNLEIDPSFDPTELTVAETEAWTYDANQAKFGHLSSQFHYRTLLQTFAMDFPFEFVDQTSPLALPSELVMNDDQAYRISGDFQSHYTYAFKVDDGLLLYDSPANDRRSEVVRAKIRSDFSTAPIKYVVHSHNHFDHTGGLRGNLAEGGELVVGAGSAAFIETVLKRPSTVLPNPIEGNTVNVIGVEDSLVIGTGDQQIILYTVPTEHAEEEDFVIIYKPFTKTIYLNDLVNPGFVFVYDGFNQVDQARIVQLAKDLVDFVDAQNLDVTTYHATHGFTTQDFDFATVRELASR